MTIIVVRCHFFFFISWLSNSHYKRKNDGLNPLEKFHCGAGCVYLQCIENSFKKYFNTKKKKTSFFSFFMLHETFLLQEIKILQSCMVEGIYKIS